MSGLMRNVIDQVLKNMGEEERAQSVNYVTDRMVEKMDNQERIALLMAIIDRVMSHLSAEERADLVQRLAGRVRARAGDDTPTGSAADGGEPIASSEAPDAVAEGELPNPS